MSDHSGHRNRLKNKFMGAPRETLDDHELLEMLLFYSIPRSNTNELAHELIDRFGSLSGVFDADAAELEEVPGIGKSSVTLIRLCSEMISRYYVSNIDTRKPFTSYSMLCEYLVRLYAGTSKETVYLLLFNNAMRLIKTVLIGTGSVNVSALQMRSVVERALRCNASYALLAHNHPNGLAVPSNADIDVTHRINQALALINVNFIDHIIVAGEKCSPVLHMSDSAPGESFNHTLENNLKAGAATKSGDSHDES